MTDTDNAWDERTPLSGTVDFTMMYIAHDAFARDLRRLASATERGHAWTPDALAAWAMFEKQLHIHHTAEDVSLWPALRAKAVRTEEVAVLDAMELEHAQIDPHLEAVDQALASRDAASGSRSTVAAPSGAAHSGSACDLDMADAGCGTRGIKIAASRSCPVLSHGSVALLQSRLA
jgi:Hemerythrin HHE cation binding domain